MSFNDDDQIVLPNSAPKRPTFVEGLLQVSAIKKSEAPPEQTGFKVLLELTGAGSGNDRHGVDIVAVLDVSGSMKGAKLEQLKVAMKFLVRKLSPIDRLSLVTFSNNAVRLCRLRQITDRAQAEVEGLIDSLHAGGRSNTSAGLEEALKVIRGRRLSAGRGVAVVLMSDGDENMGRHAANVDVSDVPVHTFGFQDGSYNPEDLHAIATHSTGGTFSLADVQNSISSNLSIVFSQCLGGLLTTVVHDLRLKVRRVESEIQKVSAEKYRPTKPVPDGSVILEFGNLYIKETRKIIVDLVLPAAKSGGGVQDILEYSYSYTAKDGRTFHSGALYTGVKRMADSLEPERPEVMAEEARLGTAKMMKDARELADEGKLDDARDKLEQAQCTLLQAQGALDGVAADAAVRPLIDMMRHEVRQLLSLMRTPELYKTQGRSFALSSETSHDRQRFAARGDAEKLRLFATPRMDAYLKQARAFSDGPSKPVPTAEEDVKKELADDPFAPIIGPVSKDLEAAIRALQAVQGLHKAARACDMHGRMQRMSAMLDLLCLESNE